MCNAERSMENRRFSGAASMAAHRGHGSSGDYAPQPADDPDHDLWRRRASAARLEIGAQITANDMAELIAAITAYLDANLDTTRLQIYRGWQAVARFSAGETPARMFATWREAAEAAR